MKHLLSIEDLNSDQISNLFRLTQSYQDSQMGIRTVRSGEILATLFFEPSTRTRLSFESAMLRLGGSVISASDIATTSCAKGESLEDTIRVISESYADILVVRHPDDGAVQLAAEYSAKPVINGGDGSGEHPTQALCDLYALWKHVGDLVDTAVVIYGDVRRSRAAHSFKKGLEIMGAYTVEIEHDRSGCIRQYDFDDATAIYITRPQLERGSIPINETLYNREARHLTDMLRHSLIMHPLPRTGEISKELDADPRSIYFEQAKAGVPIRTVVLAYLLGIMQL
jgi:aspartate carbamoyltransferase catalytic subunit